MVEPASALLGREDGAEVRVRDGGVRGMVTIRADLSAEAVQRAIGETAGLHLPDRGRATLDGERGLLWMSPDELLLLCSHGESVAMTERLREALANEHALVVDVSDARALISVDGQGLRDVIAKLAPVDLHRDRFPVGSFRRTRLGQVAAAFWLTSDTHAEVVCFRSVAPYVFGLLAASARDGRVGFLEA